MANDADGMLLLFEQQVDRIDDAELRMVELQGMGKKGRVGVGDEVEGG